jgi:hypothetical protein
MAFPQQYFYDHEEAGRIEYELSRDTAMVQFNKEVIVIDAT